MDSQEEIERLLDEAIESIKTSVLTLETVTPLLEKRHNMFQEETTRLIAALHTIEGDLLALVDAGDTVDLDYEALMRTVATEVVMCAICGRSIESGDHPIRTTTGGSVHLACADQQSTRALARRRRWALAHGITFVSVVIAVGLIAGITLWLLAFTMVGLAFHIVLHHRWWYYLRRDLGTWLLLGARRF